MPSNLIRPLIWSTAIGLLPLPILANSYAPSSRTPSLRLLHSLLNVSLTPFTNSVLKSLATSPPSTLSSGPSSFRRKNPQPSGHPVLKSTANPPLSLFLSVRPEIPPILLSSHSWRHGTRHTSPNRVAANRKAPFTTHLVKRAKPVPKPLIQVDYFPPLLILQDMTNMSSSR